MRVRLAVVVVLALVAGGCGGGGGSASGGDSAAGLVPAGADVFLSVNTDLKSDQIQNADDVLQKFPIRERLLNEIRSSLTDEGVNYNALKRSIGPEVDIAVLDVDNDDVVAFTQPRDEEEFNRVLDSGNDPDEKTYHTRIDDWTVFSDEKALLDKIKDADDHLDDADAYQDATSALPDDALATAYVRGAVIREALDTSGIGGATAQRDNALGKVKWLSAAATSHDDGVDVEVHLNGKRLPGGDTYDASVADDIPRGALAAASFKDLGQGLRQIEQSGIPFLGQIENAVGVRVRDVAELLEGEGALYVRSGNPVPEVTVLVEESNRNKAERTLDRIARALARNGAGTIRHSEVDGVKLDAIAFGPISVYYGFFDGKVIVTDNANAVRDVRGDGDKLDDDKTFSDAKDASGLPDETNGWVYVNLKDAIPMVESLMQLGGDRLPADVDANLRPLRSFVLYGSRDGDTQTIRAFLGTS